MRQNPSKTLVRRIREGWILQKDTLAAPETKGQRVLALLLRPAGATLGEIIAKAAGSLTASEPSSAPKSENGWDTAFNRPSGAGMRVYRILPSPLRGPKMPQSAPRREIDRVTQI